MLAWMVNASLVDIRLIELVLRARAIALLLITVAKPWIPRGRGRWGRGGGSSRKRREGVKTARQSLGAPTRVTHGYLDTLGYLRIKVSYFRIL